MTVNRYEKIFGGYLIKYAPLGLSNGRFAAQAAVFRTGGDGGRICVIRPHPSEFDGEDNAATAGLAAAEGEIKTGTIERSDW